MERRRRCHRARGGTSPRAAPPRGGARSPPLGGCAPAGSSLASVAVPRRLRISLDVAVLGALLAGGIAEALGDSTLTARGHAVGVAGATAAVGALTFRRRAPEASF